MAPNVYIYFKFRHIKPSKHVTFKDCSCTKMHILCNICINNFIPKTYIWYDTLKAYEKKKKGADDVLICNNFTKYANVQQSPPSLTPQLPYNTQ